MDIKGIKEILRGRKVSERYDGTEFRRRITVTETQDGEQIITPTSKILAAGTGTHKSKGSVILDPVRTLSLEEFSFPFPNMTKITTALRLQVMPYAAAGELELFPVITSRTGRSVNGIVWYTSPDELDNSAGNVKIWPAPLPFISQLSGYNGSGVTMWIDEVNICSLLWQSNKPVLYRWSKNSGETSETRELEWYDEYCKSEELDRGGNFVINVSGDTDVNDTEEFYDIVNESIKLCPWISGVNISRTALEGARDLERTVSMLTRVSVYLLVLGAITLTGCIWKYGIYQGRIDEVNARSENYYRQVFDPSHTGRIANPVTLARDKLAGLSGSGADKHPLDEVLAELGEIYASSDSLDVTIDIIRYNSDGIDFTGSAPDMTTILNFRRAWEGKAGTVQLDNSQFVSGIGYRFDLRIRW